MRRLILFDIDGTLVWGGPAKDAFQVAMTEVFGTVGRMEVHSFAGKTDPQIARELLTGAGLTHEEVERGFPDLWRRYVAELSSLLPEDPMEVLAGVPELLEALDDADEAVLGLVTGNIVEGARLKLGSAGLLDRFRVGSYGSDDEVRNHLPGIAIRRAREAFGVPFERRDVVIVGDTPLDVACGLHEGTRTVAVATGHHDVDELEAAGPDRVFRDLGRTRDVVRALLDGA